MEDFFGFPVMLNLNKVNVLLVGGGKVAYRKLKKLIEYGSNIKVVSPKLIEPIKELIEIHHIEYNPRNYEIKDLRNIQLCISATDSKEVNSKITKDCGELKLLCNSITQPEEGNCTFPAFFNDNDLTVSVSTTGKSPLLSRMIKEDLQDYCKKYSDVSFIIGEFRSKYNESIPLENRKDFWESAVKLILAANDLRNIDTDLEKLAKKYC